MTRFNMKVMSVLLSALSCVMLISAHADETTAVSTTTVNPSTNETTTTTVNPATQDTTITKSNPETNQTTIIKSNPLTNETTTTIVTPEPQPQEVVQAPQGYVNCFTVDAGWYKNVWVPKHSVCQYDATAAGAQGVAWIAGHWVCTKYTVADQACTKWEWRSGHWVKTFEPD